MFKDRTLWKEKISRISPYALIVFLFIALVLIQGPIAGINSGTIDTSDTVGSTFTASSTYAWTPHIAGIIHSLKINGNVQGSAKVFIEYLGNKYVLFEHTQAPGKSASPSLSTTVTQDSTTSGTSTPFSQACAETCDINFNADSYTFIIDLDNADSSLSIDSIDYSVEPSALNDSNESASDESSTSHNDKEIIPQVVTEDSGNTSDNTSNSTENTNTLVIPEEIQRALEEKGTVRVILRKNADAPHETTQSNAGKLTTNKNLGTQQSEINQDTGLEIEQETSEIISTEVTPEKLAQIQASGQFSEIIIDHPVEPLIFRSMNITKIQDVKNTGLSGLGKIICVIDTGVNYSLFNKTLNQTIFGYDFINHDEDPMDDNGHGTSIVDILLKIAPGATIYAPKVIDANGVGYESDVLAGLQYCMDNHVDIISFSIGAGMSQGYCDSNIVAEKSNEAVAQGIYVVAATGNDGSRTSLRVPSCGSNITRVAASNKDDTIATFSNLNAIVDLVTPGNDLEGVGIDGSSKTLSGTSFASPFVAGAAALLIENRSLENRSMTPQEITALFKSTSDALEFENTSYFRLNLLNAINENITQTISNDTAIETNFTGEQYDVLSNMYFIQRNTSNWANTFFSGATDVWSNPVKADVQTDLASGSASVALASAQISYYLNGTFSFGSLPAGTTLKGIIADINKRAIASGISDNALFLVSNGVQSNHKETSTSWPTSFVVVSYGANNDLWGLSSDATTFTSNNLYVLYSAKYNTASTTAYVDWIGLRVYYVYNPAISKNLNFTDFSAGHGFYVNATATQTDPQNLSTIIGASITSSVGNCVEQSNFTSQWNFSIKYNCTGTALSKTNITISFLDNNGIIVNTTKMEYTYPNHAPTIVVNTSRTNAFRKADTITIQNFAFFSDPDGDSIDKEHYLITNSTGGKIFINTDVHAPQIFCRTDPDCKSASIINITYYVNDSYGAQSNAVADYLVVGGQGPKYSPLTANFASGSVPWTNPDAANFSDNIYAFADVSGVTSHHLTATNFNFNIPTGNNITGVMSDIEKKGSGTVTDGNVNLFVNGIPVGSNLAKAGSWPSNDATFIYGNYSEKWGNVLTPTNVNQNNFGVGIKATGTGSATAYVDQIRLAVFDNSPLQIMSDLTSHVTTPKHGFNVTIILNDTDGPEDIIDQWVSQVSIGGCTFLNYTNDPTFLKHTVTFNCSGPGFQTPTVTFKFNDSANVISYIINNIQYPNTAPVPTSIVFNATVLRVGDSINVTGFATDIDGDTTSGLFRYYNDGDALSNKIKPTNAVRTTDNTLLCLRNIGCTKGANISVFYEANDSFGVSSTGIFTSIIVSNTNVTLRTNITFTPYAENHSVNVTASAYDIDGGDDAGTPIISATNGACSLINFTVADTNYTSTFKCTGTPFVNTQFNITFNDSEKFVSTNNSFYTYRNNVPVAYNIINLSTLNITRNMTVNFSGNYSDADGDFDSIAHFFKFSNSTGTMQNYSSNYTFDCNLFCVKGMVINVSYYANDSYNISNIVNRTFVVQNSNPTLTSDLQIVNYTTMHAFNVTASVTDIDGANDIVAADIATLSGTCQNISTVKAGNLYTITFNCTGTALTTTTVGITFTDASSASVSTSTVNAQFPNANPTATFIYFSRSNYTKEDVLNVTFSAQDNDSDSLTYLFKFGNKTLIFQNYSDIQTFNCSADASCKKGQTINVTFFANDSFGISNTFSNSTFINNSLPVIANAITFVNTTTGHTFTAYLNVTDQDGYADIKSINFTTTSGTCGSMTNYSYNTISGINRSIAIALTCTGIGLQQASIQFNVTDYWNASLITSANNSYPNLNPTISNPSFNQSTYESSLDLNASALVNDADLDGLNVTFYYFINDVLRKTVYYTNVANGTNISDSLENIYTFAKDKVHVNVTVTDPSGISRSTISTNVTITDNTAPLYTEQIQAPNIFQNTSNISFNVRIKDDDGVWYAFLETNDSYSWVNHSILDIAKANYLANFSIDNGSMDSVFVDSGIYVLYNNSIIKKYIGTGPAIGTTISTLNISNVTRNATGLTYLNGRLYVTDNLRIYEIDVSPSVSNSITNGTYTGFNITTSVDTNPSAITYANGKFYITGKQTNKTYEYAINGSLTGFNFSTIQDPEGITYIMNKFYVLANTTVYEYNSAGSLTGKNFSITQEGAQGDPKGLAYAYGKFFITGANVIHIFDNVSNYTSPTIVNSIPGIYSNLSFTWYNPNLVHGDIIGWKVYYVDYSGNANETVIRSLKSLFTSNAHLEMEQTYNVLNMTYTDYNFTLHPLLSNDGDLNISNCTIVMQLPENWTSNFTNNTLDCGQIENGTIFNSSMVISIPGKLRASAPSIPFILNFTASWRLPNNNAENDSTSTEIYIDDFSNIDVISNNVQSTIGQSNNIRVTSYNITSSGNIISGAIRYNASNITSSWIQFSPATGTLNLQPGISSNVSVNVSIPLGAAPGNYTALINSYVRRTGVLFLRDTFSIFITVPENNSWTTSSNLQNKTIVDQGTTAFLLGTIIVNNTGNVIEGFNSSVNVSDGSLYLEPEGSFSVENQTYTNVNVFASIPSGYTSGILPYSVQIRKSFTDIKTFYGSVNVTNSPPTVNNVTLSTSVAEVNGLQIIIANVTDIGGVNRVWYSINITNDTDSITQTGFLYNTSNTIWQANYTPPLDGSYLVTIYANDTENAIGNSSELPFTALGTTAISPVADISSITITNITQTYAYKFPLTITLLRGSVTAYNANLTWDVPSGWNISSNYTLINNMTSSTLTYYYNLTVAKGILASTYNPSITANWKNPDNTFESQTTSIEVIVAENPQVAIQPRSANVLSHNSSVNISFYVNATGNSNVSGVTLSCLSGIVCTVFNSTSFNETFNESVINITAGSYKNVDLQLRIPAHYDPGSYNGIINATSSANSATLNVSVNVSRDGSWSINTATFNITVGKLNNGTVAIATIHNYGNINLTFIATTSNASLAFSNYSTINVSKNSSTSFAILYTAPDDISANTVAITLYNNSANPSNVTINATINIINFETNILSPTPGIPVNTSNGSTIVTVLNATLDNTIISSGLNFSVSIDNNNCPINNYTFDGQNYAINCTAPFVPDGYFHNLTTVATIVNISASTRSTSVNPIYYYDVTPPNITLIQNITRALGSKVQLVIQATDNVDIAAITAKITSPDGSSTTETLSRSGSTFSSASYFDFDIGDYDVLYTATDTSGNEINDSSWFEIYDSFTLIGSITDIYGNPKTADIYLYKPDTNRLLFNFSGGPYSFTSGQIHNRPYDINVRLSNINILLRNQSFSSSTQDIAQLQSLIEDALTIPLYRELYGVAVITNFTGPANITLNYSTSTLIDPLRATILKCSNYTVVGGIASCHSDWTIVNSTINTTLKTVRAPISGFSAYIAVESMCGNGLCQLGYGEDASTCAVDCSGGSNTTTPPPTTQPTGGGGGGGGGPGLNGSFVNQSDFEAEVNKTHEILDQIGRPLQNVLVSEDSIEFELIPNESSTRTFVLRNPKNKDIDVNLIVNASISNFITVDPSLFTIKANDAASIRVKASIPGETPLGTYNGLLLIYSREGFEDSVAVRIRVQNVTNPITALIPGEKNKIDFSKILQKTSLLQIVVLLIVLVLLGMGVGKTYTAIQRRKRYQFKVNNALLPKKHDRSIFAGKLAESSHDAYLELDKMQTHTIVAGATGSGKSVAAQVIIEEALKKGIAVIVFDPTAQWSGFLRANHDPAMLAKYAKFGMSKKDAKPFNGNIYQINNELETIDIKRYIKPGEVNIFTLHKLNPKTVDLFVASTVRQIFLSNPAESAKLNLLIVYDEVHRLLPKFGGSGQGYIQIERACREFRKWGIGLVLISQVLSDFIGEIKANIGTQIQMRTADESDLERLRIKYGEDVVKSIVKADIGAGMIENPTYNKGLPYFVHFRPLLHSTTRLPDAELDKYNSYNIRVDDILYQIEQLENEKVDIFELKIEVNLVLDKLKAGKFDMVDVYMESIDNILKRYWTKVGKKPLKRQVKLVKYDEIQQDVQKAKNERAKVELESKNETVRYARKILQTVKLHNVYFLPDDAADSVLMAMDTVRKRGYKLFVLTPRKIAVDENNTASYALTEEPGIGNISPTNMPMIEKTISDFAMNKGGIIFVDDITKLRNYYAWDEILLMLARIKAALQEKNMLMIASYAPSMLHDKELVKLKNVGELL
jgi:hypothetical protein